MLNIGEWTNKTEKKKLKLCVSICLNLTERALLFSKFPTRTDLELLAVVFCLGFNPEFNGTHIDPRLDFFITLYSGEMNFAPFSSFGTKKINFLPPPSPSRHNLV